jgi:hypothetical protein
VPDAAPEFGWRTRDVESSTAKDHAGSIVNPLDLRFSEALAATAQVTPASFPTFTRYLDPDWIEQALSATGTATLRRRRPSRRVQSPRRAPGSARRPFHGSIAAPPPSGR